MDNVSGVGVDTASVEFGLQMVIIGAANATEPLQQRSWRARRILVYSTFL